MERNSYAPWQQINILKEGIDYYFNEQGLMVLTAKYLLERGYCCGNGCKHCPYDDKNAKATFPKKDSFC